MSFAGSGVKLCAGTDQISCHVKGPAWTRLPGDATAHLRVDGLMAHSCQLSQKTHRHMASESAPGQCTETVT